MRTDAFRADKNGAWNKPVKLNGKPVSKLQETLWSQLGYLPHGQVDGVFGYRTMAAVRLFQEYMRTVGGQPELGAPDGLVGPKTRGALKQALDNDLQCRWMTTSRRSDQAWLGVLEKAKQPYAADYRSILPGLFDRQSDTLSPSTWKINRQPVHLIGIRRTAWAASLDQSGRRLNNDVFVVIANGRVMRCFGSTDPDPHRCSNSRGIPFLCKGQHAYRFGFHRMKENAAKCYRAFRPASTGVMVVRDTNGDKRLSKGDQLDAAPNPTINLHWSGRGTSNWSAGCQVIGGAVYVNDEGEMVDYWDHASVGYAGIGSRANRGAYDVMFSWMTVCAPDITKSGRICYTLLEEDDLKIFSPALHQATIADFSAAATTVASHDRSIRQLIRGEEPDIVGIVVRFAGVVRGSLLSPFSESVEKSQGTTRMRAVADFAYTRQIVQQIPPATRKRG